MKRTIVLTFIVLLLVGAGLVIVQDVLLRERPSGVQLIGIEEGVATTPSATTTSNSISRVDPLLREKADAILRRPIHASAGFPLSVRADLERQIAEAVTVLKADYNNLAPWITLGLARKVLEDYTGAAEAWEFASVIRPKNSLSFQNLGFLYGSYLKDYVRAEKNYLQAITNGPAEIGAYTNLADLYWYSMPEKRAAIPELLRRGVARAADADGRIALFARLASYYEDSKDITRAIAVIDEALAIAPGHSQLVAELRRLKEKLAASE